MRFDPKSKYFDPKSNPDKPQWYMVDVKFKSLFKNPVTLKSIKTFKELSKMRLIQKVPDFLFSLLLKKSLNLL